MPAKQKPAKAQGVTPTPALPLPQYLSAQGVLACLLISSIVFLPRSTLFSISPTSVTSLDRPEPVWLQSLTSDPAKTALWDVIGVSACMLWWSPSLRSWWNPTKSVNKEDRVRETLHVSFFGGYDNILTKQRMAGASIASLAASAVIGFALVVLGANMQE